MRYWTLFLRGVRTVPAATPSGSHLPGLSADLGQSWQDLVKLLGVLPPVATAPLALSDNHSESACSSGTRTNTTVSMNMIRQPDSVPKSPKNEHSVTVLEWTEMTQNEQPSNSVAPLKLPTSGLAARRGFSKSKVPTTVVEDQV